MRVGLLSPWASRLGGGVFEAVVTQAALIRELGATPVVIALADEHSAADHARFGDIDVHTVAVRGPGAVGYAPGLAAALDTARLDLLHLHGIWMYPSAAGAAWARRTGRPYLVSPHGMLDPWITARGRWKKALARLGYERRSWRAAARLHALTVAEAADIRRESGRDDALVIPNAITAPDAPPPDAVGAPYMLALGRVHPKKNLMALIEAWQHAAARAAGWRLVIAGWGEPADVAALRERLRTLGDDSIRFDGPAFGEQKAALLAHARFLMLPTFSEGLPMAVLEAWAAGTPTIMTAGCNLPEGFAAGAAIESGTDVAAITAALDAGAALDGPAHARMGDAARALVAARFAPAIVAAQWREAYSIG